MVADVLYSVPRLLAHLLQLLRPPREPLSVQCRRRVHVMRIFVHHLEVEHGAVLRKLPGSGVDRAHSEPAGAVHENVVVEGPAQRGQEWVTMRIPRMCWWVGGSSLDRVEVEPG